MLKLNDSVVRQFMPQNSIECTSNYLLESFVTCSFACQCAEAVKGKTTASGNSLFAGFALMTHGKSWYCYGKTAAQIARNKGVDEDRGCSSRNINERCNKEDKLCVGRLRGRSEFVYEFKEEKEIDRMYLLEEKSSRMYLFIPSGG